MSKTFYRANCKYGCGTVEITPRYRGHIISGSMEKCPSCRKAQVWGDTKRVRVTTSTHNCLAQCFDAKGDTCACVCGGKCHALGACICDGTETNKIDAAREAMLV